ncbi:MAG: sulfotransferase, partial [Phycisphaeraceae bacterium]|nr:sulfotransferase [Phycisphaeraceae bacterium]
MSPAEKIRIEDLREPVLNEAQKAALAYGESNPVDLSVDAVLSAAVERTGLDDFGPDDFLERLGLWLAETDENPERTALGRFSLYNDCVRAAANRLWIRDLLERHPEIHEQEIERPIIVVGLP